MKIAIIGTGGVGGYFGGRLAKAGNDVTFVARGEHLKDIQQNGLSVKSIKGDFIVENTKATDNISSIGLVDLVILCVKAWQVKDIAKEIIPIISHSTLVLPLQNGVLAADELLEIIKPNNIIGGLCRILSKIESAGVISHFGVEPTIVFGELDNSKTERIKLLKETFDNAGIKTIAAENIQAELWKKFIYICTSGLLAVTRSTYGEIRDVKETRQLIIDLLTEIYNLSQKMGIPLDSDYVPKTLELTDSLPYDSTTSLARDIWSGKPSEIEYQNGTVVKLAEKHGVEVPINKFIYQCLLPMEKKARNK
jgi:2-dehydropantoate 2-reductase